MTAGTRCLLCGAAGPFRLLFKPVAEDFQMMRCARCGLVFQDPQPSDAVLATSYYHDPAFTELLAGPLRQFTLTRAWEKRRLLDPVRRLRPGLRILDVGCSSGAFMEVAASAGALAEGIEVGESTAADARARGLNVHSGTLPTCFESLRSRSFDLITFWDVLEHVRDPRIELDLARRLLAPGGTVAATFPNVEGWYPQLTLRLLGRTTGIWEYPELPVHLYDFSPGTARALLAHAGLQVQAIRTTPTPFWFYRKTALTPDKLGGGPRGWAVRAAFELLRAVVYPAAQLCDRGNSLFVVACALS